MNCHSGINQFAEVGPVLEISGGAVDLVDNDARGLADLKVLADVIPARGYVHGERPTSIDAGIYGFIANIYFYEIETPLKEFVLSQPNIVRHCVAIHEAIARKRDG